MYCFLSVCQVCFVTCGHPHRWYGTFRCSTLLARSTIWPSSCLRLLCKLGHLRQLCFPTLDAFGYCGRPVAAVDCTCHRGGQWDNLMRESKAGREHKSSSKGHQGMYKVSALDTCHGLQEKVVSRGTACTHLDRGSQGMCVSNKSLASCYLH